jgi:TolB-like protein/DNA-binding SARP family transcriptional activator
VISTSGPTAAPPRFRLQTFGTLRLVRSGDETVLGDHGHQRRRLALLAVLAASGERGRSRDQLQGLFWPEVSQTRARHSLDQLLYALRTSLDDNLFASGNPVHLNAALISSDVGDFSDALARRELERAIALYRGPFLDGFYLNDAPEFEQWMDAERGRIERTYTDALEHLAKSLEAANDPSAVAPLLHKLIDIDPVSSKHAIGLIRALMNAGDHAAALRYAERYEAIVQRELGTDVGPAVAELVAEVRSRAKTGSIVVRGVPSRATAQPAGETEAFATHVAAAAEPTDGAMDQAPPLPLRFGFRRHAAVRYGIAVVALAALAVVVPRLLPRAAGSAPTTGRSLTAASIAVLPLANHSADSRDASLADGMTEELIGRLAKVTGLRVIASTSVFALQNRGMDVRHIADTLGVAHVLEGSLQKTGSRLRVHVRLLDGHDGATRWSETYDRELGDVFGVEDDIARTVVRELDLRLASGAVVPPRRQPTKNVAAYELYRHGNDRILIRTDSGVRTGIELFRQAIALDSTYAGAWAGLGRMYRLAAGPMPRAADRERYYALAADAVQKAITLDDSLAEAHETLGSMRLAAGDFQSAEQQLTRATALDPGSAAAHERLVSLFLWTGRPADALAHAERGVQLDPLAPEAHAELARALRGNDRCDEALAELDKLSGVPQSLRRVAPIAAECYARERRWSEAIAVLRPRAERGETQPLALFGFMLGRSGQREQAQDVRATLLTGWRRGEVGAFWIGVVSAGLGDREQTCAWFDRSVADHSFTPGAGDAHDIVIGPLFADVRRQPCFDKLRKQLSLRVR